MTSRSQSISTQVIFSLVAVVAVKSAVTLGRYINQPKQLESEQSEQQKKKKKVTLRSKKRGLRTNQSSNSKKVTNLRPSSLKTEKKQTPAASTMKNNFKSPLKNASMKTKKPKPRVRKSLLPWNGAKEAKLTHSPMMQQTPVAVQKDIDNRRQRRPARVRESLLPWSSTDKGPEAQPAISKKSIRTLHVPDTIRPTKIKSNEIGDENIMLQAADDASYITTRSRPSRSDTVFSTQSSPTNSIASSRHIPLKNVSNRAKMSHVSTTKRRKSRELKEAGWKMSTVSKANRPTAMSPTLMKLSSRRNDSDVRSLRKVFDNA